MRDKITLEGGSVSMERSVVSMEAEKISRKGKCIYGKESGVNGGRKKSPERRSVSTL